MNKDIKKYNLLIITPVNHIINLNEKFKNFKKVKILENPSYDQVFKIIKDYHVVFTNPNMSNVLIDKKLISKAEKLICVTTASTGTVHIDKVFLEKKRIKLISLTKEYKTIQKISSTAEHALALTLAHVRNILTSAQNVKKGEWNYTKYIGRQFTNLKVGILGYGRLGKKYSKYLLSLESKVSVYDPYKKVKNKKIFQEKSLINIFKSNDIVSLHVHVNKNTRNIISKKILKYAKNNLLIVNTSRGELVNEKDLINFLKKNKHAKYATDVLNDEIKNKRNNKLIKMSKTNDQVLITPHIGGMTIEAQEIAYGRVMDLTNKFLQNFN